MIPLDRPFLDYVLSALADAGYRRVCVVVAPHHELRSTSYYVGVRRRGGAAGIRRPGRAAGDGRRGGCGAEGLPTAIRCW